MSSAEYIPCARTCGSRRLSEVEQEGVASRPVYVTNDGLDGLLRQLSILITSKKPELLAGIQEARRLGTDEDQKLEAMTDELTIVEGLIRHLRNLIRDAVVIDFKPAPDGTASVGARVRLRAGSRQETYRIVGRLEADPSIGLISNESSLGEALLGHCAGDQIEWRSSDGINVATVLSVEWSSVPGASPSRSGPGGPVNQGPPALDRSAAANSIGCGSFQGASFSPGIEL